MSDAAVNENSNRPVIVGLGEVLWDVFPDGPRFGGAPANFACSAAGLAGDRAHVCLVSGVGRDSLGERALAELAAHGVAAESVAQLDRPTGRVDVEIDSEGKADYVFAANTAWDHLPWSDELAALAARTAAVCFGSLGQRSEASRETIRRFVSAVPETSLRILDINLRTPHWSDAVVRESVQLANVLKCNEDELPVLARLLDADGSDAEILAQLVAAGDLQLAALSRGSAGSLLLSADGSDSELPAESVTVADTVGAGDAFTAALTLGLLHGLPLPTTHAWANQVAAFVCTQNGATPTLPEALGLAAIDRN